MGDIQRWKDMWYGDDHGELLPREDGEYVLYADHVQTVAELEGMTAEFYEKAYAAGLDAAEAAVKTVYAFGDYGEHYVPDEPERVAIHLEEAIAAIRALRNP